MKSTVASAWTACWVLIAAVPASAQEAPLNWSHVRKLVPGTEIVLTVNGAAPAPRIFVAATEQDLTVLNLTDQALPRVASRTLRDMASASAERLVAAETQGSLTYGAVRVGSAGVFIDDAKVCDIAAVLEHIQRADAVGVTRPGGGALALDHPIELGLGGTGVLTWVTAGIDLRAMVSVPITERHAIELFAGPFRGTSDDPRIQTIFGFQVKQEIDAGRRPGVEPFLTYGAVGVVAREKGYCRSIDCRAPDSTFVVPPLIGLVGGGVQYVVSPRLALRVEAQGIVAFVLPLGGRFSVGVTVPIGRGYATVR